MHKGLLLLTFSDAPASKVLQPLSRNVENKDGCILLTVPACWTDVKQDEPERGCIHANSLCNLIMAPAVKQGTN